MFSVARFIATSANRSFFSFRNHFCAIPTPVRSFRRWSATLTSNAIFLIPILNTLCLLRKSGVTSYALVCCIVYLILDYPNVKIGQVYQTLIQEREAKGIKDVVI